jgi:hypothetical protein
MISIVLYLGGMGLLFMGERLFADGAMHWPLTGLGLIGAVASIGLHAAQMSSAGDSVRKRGLRLATIGYAVGLLSVAAYATTTAGFTDMLGMDEEAAARWSGTLTAVWPILWALGSVPALLIDRALLDHPVLIPPGAIVHAGRSGMIAALGIALLFPVNYLASAHKAEWDVAYFRVARPGGSTLAIATSLSTPVTAYLFYPPGSAVKEEVLPFFEELAAASGGQLSVQVVDQPMAPDLAEKFKIRTNGNIVLEQGETTQKFRLQDDMDRAKRDLKKLDSLVQQHLLKLAQGPRTVYVMTGHGEASHREKEIQLFKLGSLKTLFQNVNLKVQEFGLADGSSNAVPDDASLLVIPAPEQALLPEEERTIQEYIDRGGALWVLVEPGRDALPGVLGALGLKAEDGLIANADAHLRQTRGAADRVLLFSNRFGTHASVSTLSKNSTQLLVFLPTTRAIEELPTADGKFKRTAVIKSFPDSWIDVNNDLQQANDGTEPGKVYNLAWAVESAADKENGTRALVMGDVNSISDAMLGLNAGNQQLVLDAVRWLTRDEDIAGEINSEEDVKIAHTREEDVAWFYGTVFGIPLLVLVGGAAFSRMRRRTS